MAPSHRGIPMRQGGRRLLVASVLGIVTLSDAFRIGGLPTTRVGSGAISHAPPVTPRGGYSSAPTDLLARQAGLRRQLPACFARKGRTPGEDGAKKTTGRGKKKEEAQQVQPAAGSDDFDGEDGDEGYVFNPADFPMLDGDDDLFGEYDEEGGQFGMEAWEGDDEGEQEAIAKAKAAAVADEEGTGKRKARLPVVAVIGRPNVGKSTIVNRICRSLSTEPKAIVYDYEGVTRDRIYRRAEWNERVFEVVDTGGLIFDENADDIFAPQIRDQALLALDECVAAVFVTDGQTGPTTLDEEIARFLRTKRKPVVVAVNKCESPTMSEAWAAMFYSLGLGHPFAVSGLHGTGIAEVLEEIKPHIYQVDEAEADSAFNIAIVGRPNVGKSSLLNRLVGKERAIVSDVAGTTRDAIDALVTHEKQEYRFIDTAGIRRRKKVEHGNEFLMVNRALKAIRRSDVVLLVIDVVAGITDQDKILAQRVAEDGRACVIVANKWDAVEKDEKTFNEAIRYVREELFAVNWAEVLFTSALTGQRVHKIYEAVDRAVKTHRQRIKTSLLNEVLSDALMWQKPPAVKASQIGRIYYCNQVSVEPPTIVVFVNNPKLFPESYRRYLDRKFRESLDFKGTPIRWHFRGKKLRQLTGGKKNSTPVPYGTP